MQRKINVVTSAAFLIPLLAQVPSYGDASPEKLCEARYVDSLKNAKQALLDRRREDAIKFLLDATTIMEACAPSKEKPEPKEQAVETRLALNPMNPASTDSAL